MIDFRRQSPLAVQASQPGPVRPVFSWIASRWAAFGWDESLPRRADRMALALAGLLLAAWRPAWTEAAEPLQSGARNARSATADSTTASATAPVVENFCFVQVSDIHISPQPIGEPDPGDGRSAEVIAWVCDEIKQPQRLPNGMTAPPPAFVAATGDLVEYGTIGRTWSHFEALWKPLSVPLYLVAGNHDNTWHSVTPYLRKRHGGDHYSFDRFGCHFAMIDSASLQEPVPSLEARTLNWLRADLERVPAETPVFVFQHHPLGTNEFATPLEQIRFLELLRGRNVTLLLMGHGHGVRAERWNGLDSVMGGSTFGPNSGYSIVSVLDGILRVTYRYKDTEKPMKVLLEKPIHRSSGPELRWGSAPVAPVDGILPIRGIQVAGAEVSAITADVDGLEGFRGDLKREADGWHLDLPLRGLLPGLHYIRIEATAGGSRLDRAATFLYEPKSESSSASGREPARPSFRVAMLPAGVKAEPVPIEGGWAVATTAGRIDRISYQGEVTSLLNIGVEILHAPVIADGVMYFSAAELGVCAAALDGRMLWTRPVGAAVYGRPAVKGDRVFVGDLEGFLHAIDRRTGTIEWSKRHATFGIEMPVVEHGGMLYFGAWDGYVYAIDGREGALKWRQRGPAGQTGERLLMSRYYAPADCPPVLAGDRLFVCDRSYRLGSYSLTGEYLGLIAENTAAIGATEDRAGILSRGLERGLTRYDSTGRRIWSADVPTGRFPCPPTAVGGRVFACSNLGELSVIDARDGQLLARCQAAPRLHVMAPAAADPAGRVMVAGMDGTLSILEFGAGFLE